MIRKECFTNTVGLEHSRCMNLFIYLKILADYYRIFFTLPASPSSLLKSYRTAGNTSGLWGSELLTPLYRHVQKGKPVLDLINSFNRVSVSYVTPSSPFASHLYNPLFVKQVPSGQRNCGSENSQPFLRHKKKLVKQLIRSFIN